MKIIIVDENDNQIGLKTRDQISQNDIYRITGLWLTNSKDEILLAQRSYTKKNSPGKWGPAVAGTVEEGQSYDENIVQEAEEELGLAGLDIKPVTKLFIEGKKTCFIQWYEATTDIDTSEFKIQTDEVEAIRWIFPEELRTDLKNNPEKYLTNMPRWFKLFCS